ncbi:hypothetical protein KR059_011600, partial [Drosophila kikkawai]
IFCQYDMKSYYYKNTSLFYSWKIDTRLCTHLVLGTGIGVNEETGAVKVKNNDLLDKDLLIHGTNLKYDSVQKVIISIGGFDEDSQIFSKMAASDKRRAEFCKSLVDFMLGMGYEGAQIDWRYPTQRGGYPVDRRNFVLLLQELSLIFREHKFILVVVALGRTDKQTLESYDIPEIVKNVDFVNLMVDDERDKYNIRLSYIAPLFGGTNSVAAGVKHWKRTGKSPDKLILNVPFFGRSFTMDNNQSAVGSPCKGPGLPARNSAIAGFTTFNEYCTQTSKWSNYFDKVAKVPYATRDNQWLSFENSESIWAKMHYLKKNQLGGAMAWTIDADDFLGNCGIRFGLLSNIQSALGDPNALTTQAPTTEASGICPRDGLIRDKWECRYYYECRNGKRFEYECVEGQFFDEAKGYCRPAKEVKCDQDFVVWRPGMPLYSYENLPLNLKVVE